MQSLLNSLLLLLLVRGDVKFSIDSDETTDGSTFGGMVVLVTSDDKDEPEIVMSSDLDTYTNVYCLVLEEMFEANEYITTIGDKYGDHEDEGDSEIDFQGDVNWEYTRGTDGKSFILNGTPEDPTSDNHSQFDFIKFVFTVTTDPKDDTAYGLKYSFQVSGYQWTSTEPAAKLVLVFEIKSCKDDFESKDFSSDETDETDETTTRRRLGETTEQPENKNDEASGESDDGISSDDSNELDVGIAMFINNPIAHCLVNGSTTAPFGAQITTNLIYGEEVSSDEVHIVFDHFDCDDLFQDPYYGLENSKYTDGSSRIVMFHSVSVVFISFVVYMSL